MAKPNGSSNAKDQICDVKPQNYFDMQALASHQILCKTFYAKHFHLQV